jgi:hypothetical protein
MSDAKVRATAMVAALLATASAAAKTTAQVRSLELTVVKGQIHEIPYNDTTLYRLGATFDVKDDLFVSMRLYENEKGRLFPYPEWMAIPRQGSPFPGAATNLWRGEPSNREAGPVALASGIPVLAGNAILTAFNTIIAACNHEETGKETRDALEAAGIIYHRELPTRDGTRKVTAIAMSYADLGAPELALLGKAGQDKTIQFDVAGQDGRLCWGERPGYGVWEGENPDTKPHRIEGSPNSQAAIPVLQKAFNKARELAGKGELKSVRTPKEKIDFGRRFFEEQTAAQAGATEKSETVVPAL